MAYDKALAALADPTRRRVFERLKSGPKAVGVIARGMPVSRPAVSQHLKVLKDAGLVADRSEGTSRLYYIDPNGLGALRAWLDQFWDQTLARFQAEVELSIRKKGQSRMTTTVAIAPVRKNIHVNASQAHAFDVFTSGLGRWWPLDHGIGKTPRKAAVMETRLGGRWYELAEDGTETNVGKIIVWEPPKRFVMTWDINSQWKPDTTVSSEVEVRFIAEGTNATRVELEHRKFEQMGAEAGEKMRKDVDGGWPGLLEIFKQKAESA